MKKAIDVVFFREGSQWVARALNVEVATSGDSLDAARAAIREALELYFEDEPPIDLPETCDIRVEQVLV